MRDFNTDLETLRIKMRNAPLTPIARPGLLNADWVKADKLEELPEPARVTKRDLVGVVLV